MKLRLTQAGFENYTGQMGVVWFENGLSTTDVLPIDGIRISAALGAVWDDGSAANVGQMYLNNMEVPAFVGMADNQAKAPEPVAPVETVKQALGEPDGGLVTYTEEMLAKIADEKGIGGVREVGDKLGVKGTSIVGLIAAILKAQASQPKAE
jgi:hypothetical protein